MLKTNVLLILFGHKVSVAVWSNITNITLSCPNYLDQNFESGPIFFTHNSVQISFESSLGLERAPFPPHYPAEESPREATFQSSLK